MKERLALQGLNKMPHAAVSTGKTCAWITGAYEDTITGLCARTPLRPYNIKHHQASNTVLRPAHFLAVDPTERAIIWGVRVGAGLRL